MNFARGGDGIYDLHASIRSIVLSLTLFSVVVADIVGVTNNCHMFVYLNREVGKEEAKGYVFSNTSGPMALENSDFQKMRAFSTERPMPLRKRPYCIRPACLRWWEVFSLRCIALMHMGKDLPANSSICPGCTELVLTLE